MTPLAGEASCADSGRGAAPAPRAYAAGTRGAASGLRQGRCPCTPLGACPQTPKCFAFFIRCGGDGGCLGYSAAGSCGAGNPPAISTAGGLRRPRCLSRGAPPTNRMAGGASYCGNIDRPCRVSRLCEPPENGGHKHTRHFSGTAAKAETAFAVAHAGPEPARPKGGGQLPALR